VVALHVTEQRRGTCCALLIQLHTWKCYVTLRHRLHSTVVGNPIRGQREAHVEMQSLFAEQTLVLICVSCCRMELLAVAGP
jgi:hypothetical protein